ncbi:hypothetical protein [Thermomonospora umbrina]|uniref:Uncharacterized protein n=1 Tax=Thermomonospora umbrina TaxID=111806 RepID=A0A3D9SHQ6_9ACTN|nr:hypothetical protein [Thermomonospora umbrina]REE95436.1 hypothetical protein DFJ69_0825 [Thermomonospora umbrina]
MYRQGDVLIQPIADDQVSEEIRTMPPAPRDGRGRMVLALGEATGHAHALTAPGSLLRDGDPMTPDHLHLPSGGRLVHEEHAAISLPAGWYRVVRQREYIPGAVRVVAD